MKTATVMAFCVTGLIFSATSHAQMGHGISKNAKHVITCPVTGDKVDMDSATKSHLYSDYKGNRYFFCCKDCPPMFKKSPAKYSSKTHIKTPVASKGHGRKHQ